MFYNIGLKQIQEGYVVVVSNKHYCFVNTNSDKLVDRKEVFSSYLELITFHNPLPHLKEMLKQAKSLNNSLYHIIGRNAYKKYGGII